MSKESDGQQGVRDAWDFWLSQHPNSVPELIHDGINEAMTKWLSRYGEDLFKEAVTDWLNIHGEGLFQRPDEGEQPEGES